MKELSDEQKEQVQRYIQACQWELEGKTVQTLVHGIWQNISPSQDGSMKRKYRLKPETPKVIEAWLRIYDDGNIQAFHTFDEACVDPLYARPCRIVHVKDANVSNSEVEDLRNELAFLKSIVQARP